MALTKTTIASADVPLLRRTLVLADERRGAESILGDVDLRATHAAWRSVAQRLSISAGTKLPTSPLEHDPAGRLVHPDLQPGCGSIVPFVGVGFTWSSSWVSISTSASLLFPVAVREGSHPGDSLRSSVAFQMQPARIFATRVGVHGRLDGTGELDGEVVRRSGGAAVGVAPEIVLMPVQDLVLSAGASFPVVQEMRGYRATSPVLLASIGVDF
jgi:hypothetical protein